MAPGLDPAGPNAGQPQLAREGKALLNRIELTCSSTLPLRHVARRGRHTEPTAGRHTYSLHAPSRIDLTVSLSVTTPGRTTPSSASNSLWKNSSRALATRRPPAIRAHARTVEARPQRHAKHHRRLAHSSQARRGAPGCSRHIRQRGHGLPLGPSSGTKRLRRAPRSRLDAHQQSTFPT